MLNNVLNYSKKLKSNVSYLDWHSAWEKTILLYEKSMKYLPGFLQDPEFQKEHVSLSIKKGYAVSREIGFIGQG